MVNAGGAITMGKEWQWVGDFRMREMCQYSAV
jgi:hypothetical protein